jgi:hypothetical protein
MYHVRYWMSVNCDCDVVDCAGTKQGGCYSSEIRDTNELIHCSGDHSCDFMKVYGTTGALLCSTGDHACVNMGGGIDELDCCIICSGNACDTYPEPTNPAITNIGLTPTFEGCLRCDASAGSIFRDDDGNYLDGDGGGVASPIACKLQQRLLVPSTTSMISLGTIRTTTSETFRSWPWTRLRNVRLSMSVRHWISTNVTSSTSALVPTDATAPRLETPTN